MIWKKKKKEREEFMSLSGKLGGQKEHELWPRLGSRSTIIPRHLGSRETCRNAPCLAFLMSEVEIRASL